MSAPHGRDAFAVGVAPLVVTAAALASAWDRLAGRLATHFDLHGRADGSMARGSFTVVQVVVTAASALFVGFIVMPARRRRVHEATPATIGLATALAWLFASITVWTVLANRDTTRWHDVGGPSLVALVGFVGVAVAGGALAAKLAARLVPVRSPQRRPDVAAVLGEAAWHRHEHSTAFGAASALLACTGLALLVTGPLRAIGAVTLGLGAVLSALCCLTVAADGRGLTVRYGPLGWPRQRIGIGRIAAASAIDVRPMQWGGWGYRGSLAVLRRAAVVLRGGPGLRLDLHGGKVFVVTVDDPETAAAVITGAMQRAGVRFGPQPGASSPSTI